MNIVKEDKMEIAKVVDLLKQGKIIIYPTETVYGLGCDATNREAVKKIFAIKKRQSDKPVLVVMPDMAMAMRYVKWTTVLEDLSRKYWPGPLTVVAELKDGVDLPAGVIGPGNSLAFRVTDYPLARQLSEKLNKPLVSTSANISSQDSPYDIDTVCNMFTNTAKQPDLVIDAGRLPHQQPSTIVKVNNNHSRVLRQGAIVVETN